jgi:DNA-directed RNA polymerase subunit RPC12/RpoP
MMDLANFKIGMYHTKKDSYSIREYVCSCGNKYESDKWGVACTKCGNTNFERVRSNRYINVKTDLEVIEKDDSHFVVKRIGYSAKPDFENGKVLLKKQDHEYKLCYSFRNKEMKLYKDDNEVIISDKRLDYFFSLLDTEYILDTISTPKNRTLFKIAYIELGSMGYEVTRKMSRGLIRLLDRPYLQILSACEFDYDALRQICYVTRRDYEDDVINKNETAPHKILGVKKYVIPFLKNIKITSQILKEFKCLDETIDGNTVKKIMKIFAEESSMNAFVKCLDDLITIYKVYGYTDMIKLTTYITRDVKLQQGITMPNNALSLLIDYAKTSKLMNHSYEKYPKSLKKVHDVTTMNYNMYQDIYKEQAFQKAINESVYQNLMYKNKTYSIIIPLSVKSVCTEGQNLSHCVATYCNDIINGKCQIYFMRNNENIDESLITIEVRNNCIRQVKGKLNRKPFSEEVEFVGEWAKNKELESIY